MRTRIALVLSLLTGLALVASPAQARTSDVDVPVTETKAVTVTGNGYGHGRGMSQHGAQGRASAGQTVDQILRFYYPGTIRSKLAAPLRVWITGDSDHSTQVRPAKGLTVTDLGTGRTFKLPTAVKKAKAWRLSVVAGQTRVSYLRPGKWLPYRPGGRIALKGAGEFRATGNMLTLVYGGATHVYRGKMRLVAGRTVNVVSFEAYLRGVVASEMPALWKTHALRAQAVAARTYAAFERADYLTRSYQVCDTTACQVYRGVSAEHPSTDAAIAATAGWILTSAGKPAFTQFSASNGGQTADGGRSYLPSTADAYDTAYRGWTTSITGAAIQKAYPGIGTLVSVRVTARDGHGQWGGRVTSVLLHGSTKDVTVSGSAFRSLAGLRSNYFTLS